MPKPVDHTPELIAFDKEYRRDGIVLAGMDEAGRGPLAGPVVCACVVFDEGVLIPYVNDSKKLSEKRREDVYEKIMEKARCVGIGIADNRRIDEINILNATKEAFKDAINSLGEKPDIILADAIEIDGVDIKQVPIVKGDAKSFSIAAASIVAKVTRDRIMQEFDITYPGYNFKGHKGYGTAAHYEALRNLGPCPIHRNSFLKKVH